MKLQKNKLILLLLFATLFKSLTWLVIVPMWHTPDEQAHFAQLQYMVERKKIRTNPQRNLSQEIALSEDLLGTRRDVRGNNKFTYHPEFNVPYSSSLVGINENKINTQPRSTRVKIVGEEAANYPPLYYAISSYLYNLSYNSGLIDRLFIVRFASLFLNLLLVVFAYKIGKQIWKSELLPITLAALVSFHPMVSFVAAGYHPDNLLNLLYSAGTLALLSMLKRGFKTRDILFTFFIIFLGFQTKIFIVFFIPVALSVAAYTLFRRSKFGLLLASLTIVSPVFALVFRLPIPYIPQVSPDNALPNLSFVEYMKYRGSKLFFEIFPWYWGVFKWLGLTLPVVVLRVITRIFGLAIVGAVIRILKMIKDRRVTWENQAFIFFALSSTSYALYLIVWDWLSMQRTGFSVGLQGRYFFPNIVPHMAIILMGLLALIPKRWRRLQLILPATLIILMICLNFIALYVIASSYYDLNSLNSFVSQASQYRPYLLKGSSILFIVGGFGLSVLLFTFKLFTLRKQT